MTTPARLKIERVPIDSVRPLKLNPRRGDVDFIKASLKEDGQYIPLIVRADTDEILKGNHTWHGLKELGATHVFIVRREVKDDADAQRFATKDNRASDRGTYDPVDLAASLAMVDDLAAVGYSDADMERITADALKAVGDLPDEPDIATRPQPQPRHTVTFTKRDDAALGRHATHHDVEPAVIIRWALAAYLKANPLPRRGTTKEKTQ